jgi:hypothetical protein
MQAAARLDRVVLARAARAGRARCRTPPRAPRRGPGSTAGPPASRPARKPAPRWRRARRRRPPCRRTGRRGPIVRAMRERSRGRSRATSRRPPATVEPTGPLRPGDPRARGSPPRPAVTRDRPHGVVFLDRQVQPVRVGGLDGRATLAQRRRLLGSGGWLSLLAATCLIDLDEDPPAVAYLRTAEQLARETGHAEIAAWVLETRAWMEVTAGNYCAAVTLAQGGQRVARAMAAPSYRPPPRKGGRGRGWATPLRPRPS